MRLTLRERMAAVELLVLDVDGVLTGGGIVYGAVAGETTLEVKAFHVRDGSALKRWHLAGKRSAIVTGRTSAMVDWRAAELGVAHVVQGASDKLAGLERLLAELNLSPQAICYVGDDGPDVPAMRRAGLAVAVADAAAEARAAAHYVTRAAGGAGAAREVIERVLRVQGKWEGPGERGA
jgi:3-deoxy-D-manno-octulosonate 8-phosphate phosphatase (KDO 8-P phosphatase)